MEYFFVMKLLQSNHDLYGEFPDGLFLDGFAHLAFDVFAEVAFGAVLHDDEELVVLEEGVEVLDDVGGGELFH